MKKIALIIDIENWAFDIEAKLLKEKLKDYYIIDIYSADKYDNNLFKILDEVKYYDIIHFFWRKLLIDFNKCTDNKYLKLCNKISTGIYDHLFINEDEIDMYKNIFTKYVNKYYTCSKKLENIYRNIKDYPNPYGTIHDTYDNKLYDGGNRERYNNKDNNSLIVGWVGNSNWNIKYKDFKGFHTILEPVIYELESKGYNIIKNYADRNIMFRTNEEMPEYYQTIDVCVITSLSEGTPRCVIEAMASGVPIVSTDVGIVKEVLGSKQLKYIIGDRNIDSIDIIKNNLKNKLIELYNDKNKIIELSKENYKLSINNDIDHLYLEYKKYFDSFF